MTAIYMSLEPVWALGISNAAKDHEFRKRLPEKPFSQWFIYVTVPVGQIKYVATVGAPIQYPAKIDYKGFGNTEFNRGDMTKFAIPVLSLDELVVPIDLNKLRIKFNFTPPQFFAYDSAYPDLTQAILSAPKKEIFTTTPQGILCVGKDICEYWGFSTRNNSPQLLSDELRRKKFFELRAIARTVYSNSSKQPKQ